MIPALLDLTALLSRPDWREHFALAGCAWAVPMIEAAGADENELLKQLSGVAWRRNGQSRA